MEQGLMDLHTHILPGVDDGSESMEQTVHMLQIAYEEGIRTIIATPHYEAGAKNLAPEQLKQICSQVQDEAWKIDRDMKILLGNELYYSESILEAIQSGAALTLAGSRYILVEFSPKEAYNNIFRGLTRLTGAGYLPIVAHIERYRCLYKKEDAILELHNLGCYLQMNCKSLLGGILDTEAMYHRKLIQQGLIHFLGSDCHDDQVRLPCMMKAKKQLQKRCDEGILNKLFYENPLKVLENTYI